MKTFLKILAGFVLFIAIVLGVAFYTTSGMTDTADEFFSAVKQQDLAKARGYLSEEFKASTDEAALKAFLSKSSILNFKEARWSARNASADGRGELNGSITTETGGNIPIRIAFVKEHNAWKIYALNKPAAGIQTSETTGRDVPGKEALITLAKKSMHDFSVSMKNKSMEHFHQSISKVWQNQFTIEKLDEAYGSFFSLDVDLTILDAFEPILEGDALINENGWLVIKGRYPTKPSQVMFEQKYIYEGTDWKLTGFHINIK